MKRPLIEAWRRVVAPLVVSRILILGAIVWLTWFTAAFTGLAWNDTLHSAFFHWDTQTFLRIADHGYLPRLDPDDAFLPGYPLLVAMAGSVVGDRVVGGLIVSLVAEAVALYYIYRLVDKERDPSVARFAVWLVALAPFAIYLSAVYTESMFIAAAAASLYYMRDGRFVLASLAAAVACSTRITGVAVVAALLIEYLSQRGLRWRFDALILVVAPLPLLAFVLYMHFHVGDGLALLHANQLFFGINFGLPWDGFWSTWNTFIASNGDDRFTFFCELLFGVLGITAGFALWLAPRFARSLAAYCSVVILMAVSLSFWRSVPRYELELFPAIIVVADITRRWREVRLVIVTIGAMLFVWGVTIFAQGQWLA